MSTRAYDMELHLHLQWWDPVTTWKGNSESYYIEKSTSVHSELETKNTPLCVHPALSLALIFGLHQHATW